MAVVTLVEVPPQLVIGKEKRGPYSLIPEVIGELAGYAMENGVELVGAPIAIMHETSEEEAKKADREGNALIDIAFPVAGACAGTELIRCYELPGGTMARTVHRGPYANIPTAYIELFKWIQKNGKQIVGPVREVYLNDPGVVPSEEIATEIYAPVK